MCMWLLGTCFRGVLVGAGGVVRLSDCKGLLQPKGSITYADTGVYIHTRIYVYIYLLYKIILFFGSN